MNASPPVALCELCLAEEAYNFHHSIPRTLHSNKWFKKRFTREEMGRGLNLCKQCHSTIHEIVPDEKELGRRWNTRDKLLAHPQIGAYVAWKQRNLSRR